MINQNIRPMIRFSEFSLDWVNSELGSIANFNPKGKLPEIFKYVDLESVKGSSLISYRVERKDSAPSRAQRLAKIGDVFYQTVRPYQKNNYLFDKVDKDYVFSSGYAQLRPICDGSFLLTLLQRDSFVQSVLDNCTGTSYPAINSPVLARLKVNHPCQVEEHIKLGVYFQCVENQLKLHQIKFTKLQQLKKAMLGKMFPKNGNREPELRFTGFSKVWSNKKLVDITDSYSGGTPTVGMKEYYGGDIPFIRSGEIASNRTELFVTVKGLKNSSAKMVEKGCILYALYGATSGEVAISKIDGAINQAILAIKPTSNYDSRFIALWLEWKKQEIISTYLQGGQGNLSGAIIKNLSFHFPCFDEQNKIGEYFQNLDRLINLQQQQIDKLKNLKQAYLTRMFV
uniref:restriction endonuclease subunit S n=1 Tax=Photobacterium leiognathi TaxID=553611 RepID=UPI003B969361